MDNIDSYLRRQFGVTILNLAREDLVELNRVMQKDLDPRTLPFYGTVARLFTEEREGIPIVHEAVKEALEKILLARLR